MLLPYLAKPKRRASHINCASNLKQIGISFWIRSGDNNGKFPMQVSVTNGGTMELIADGKNTWLNFLVMSNELSTPKVLVCPADARTRSLPPVYDFSPQLEGHVSYFVGMDATTNRPQLFLSGDDNFAIDGVPAKSGLLEFSTNAPIAWNSERHVYSYKSHFWTPTRYEFTGNIGLVDGSVASTTSASLQEFLVQTDVATNRLAIP